MKNRKGVVFRQIVKMSKLYDPYQNVIDVMEQAMEVAHINTAMFEILKNPQRETKVYLPVEMDDGTVKVFEGYRVQHSNIRGPFKGGIRYHQDCTLNEWKELTLERDQVNEMLEKLMSRSFDDLLAVVDECHCTLRMATYIVALRKLVYAEEIKGIFP